MVCPRLSVIAAPSYCSPIIMIKHTFRISSLLALLYVTLATAAAPGYVLRFPDQQDWKLGHEQKQGDSFIQEFVKRHERVQAWSEMVTISHMKLATKVSADAVSKRTIDGLRKGCPSFNHSVLSSDLTHVIVRWSDEGCGGWPAQEGVMQFTSTDDGVFNFQYAYLKNKASPDFEGWVKIISEAKILR